MAAPNRLNGGWNTERGTIMRRCRRAPATRAPPETRPAMSTLPKPVPLLALIAALALFPAPARPAELPVVDHVLDVHLDPAAGELRVTDRLTLPPGRDTVDLLLHRDLAPRVLAGEATLERRGRDRHLETLRLRLAPAAAGTVTLSYGGAIRHGLTTVGEGMGRERQETAGIIGPEGVFLDGTSGWYPRLPGDPAALRVAGHAARGLAGGVAGGRPGAAGVRRLRLDRDPAPGRHLSDRRALHPLSRARPGPASRPRSGCARPTPTLAAGYLAATRDYLDLYSRLIGPYPYAKFALVENFWETGYGMPSFTLLGPQVIRLPFILDHLLSPRGAAQLVGQRGLRGRRRRQLERGPHRLSGRPPAERAGGPGRRLSPRQLQAYADYVRTDRDFPLDRSSAAVTARSVRRSATARRPCSSTTCACNWATPPSSQGLRRFYADNRFRAAGYADLRRAFEAASGQDLGAYFTAWTTRTGAPRLALREVRSEAIPTGTG